jgi:GNAT superfamily N-acetyltransferase
VPDALRPMTLADARAAVECMTASFSDLERRLGLPVSPPPADPEPALVRIRHLVTTDPGGAWVAEADGRITGAALALVRDGVWGLSLLVVEPGRQSNGTGSALLRASLEPAEGTRGGIILASEDSRALRAYFRSGFDLSPAMDVHGRLRTAPPAPAGVRDLRWPQDEELVASVGRTVRAASHAADVQAWLDGGNAILVHDDGGFAVFCGERIKLVAGIDDAVAAALLRALLARMPAAGEVKLDFITAGQDWAVRELFEAGLELRPGGAVFTRGDVGPMRPYIPSGSYL